MASQTPIRLLIMAIVQEQDLDRATTAAEALGAPVVHLVSTGGFLGNRNSTLLIGLPEGSETELVDALYKNCQQRVEYMTMPIEGAPFPLPASVPVSVGGGTIFAIPVEYYEEI